MGLLTQVAAWLTDPVNWQGPDGIPARVGEHLALSATGLLLAVVIALPLGVLLGHTGRGAGVVINVANVGRALPSLAVLALVLPLAFRFGLGLGFWPTVLMLVPLAVPLVLINAYVAVSGVDRDVVDVARGLGMRGREVLREVELPLAAPLIIAGMRNAAVTVVATATLGALVASGGLGRYIIDGLARQDTPRLVVGALLVALLSAATELAFNAVERLSVPAGVRRGSEPARLGSSLAPAPAGAAGAAGAAGGQVPARAR